MEEDADGEGRSLSGGLGERARLPVAKLDQPRDLTIQRRIVLGHEALAARPGPLGLLRDLV